MIATLQTQFEAVERQRIALQNTALALSDTQRDWKPNPDVWSVQQIIEHLVLSAETIGQANATEVTEQEAPLFRGLPRAARWAMILAALRNDKTLPLPSSAIEPQGNVPLGELLTRWETAQCEMRCVLDTLQGSERRYWHPVLGSLTAAQMLELGEVHTGYHTRQLEALQHNPAFPNYDC